jgi:hypothetical protein
MPEISTQTADDPENDDSDDNEPDIEIKRPPCQCGAWDRAYSSCRGDMRNCKYAQTRLALRALHELPVRTVCFRYKTTSNDASIVLNFGDAPLVEYEEDNATIRSVHLPMVQNCDAMMEGEDGTGNVLWASSILLANFFSTLCQNSHTSTPLAGRSALELGCGSGLASMCAYLCGANVVATDRVLGHLQQNISNCAPLFEDGKSGSLSSRIQLVPHTWGEDLASLDRVIPAHGFDLVSIPLPILLPSLIL